MEVQNVLLIDNHRFVRYKISIVRSPLPTIRTYVVTTCEIILQAFLKNFYVYVHAVCVCSASVTDINISLCFSFIQSPQIKKGFFLVWLRSYQSVFVGEHADQVVAYMDTKVKINNVLFYYIVKGTVYNT